MRVVIVAVLLAAFAGAAGCGTLDDAKKEGKKQVARIKDATSKQVEKVKAEARKQVANIKDAGEKLSAEAEKARDKVLAKVNDTLAKIRRAKPKADEDTPVPTLRASKNDFEKFSDAVLTNVNRYWTDTFAAADLRRPRARSQYVRPGKKIQTRCGEPADDMAAFYCPADDTIYFGEAIGQQIYDNIGDFGVAYALAHEFAHNVQQELGWFSDGARFTTVAPFELQADCMAGTWAYAVYNEGLLDDADVTEAVDTAYAVGDFDLTNPQHHGTPEERSNAWRLGYESGDPSGCQGFTA
jgi:predicted metalloprotease